MQDRHNIMNSSRNMEVPVSSSEAEIPVIPGLAGAPFFCVCVFKSYVPLSRKILLGTPNVHGLCKS